MADLAKIFEDFQELGDKPYLQIHTATVFLALGWTAVALRVYVRAVMIRSFGWDDSTMIFTLALYTAYCSTLIVSGNIEVGALPKTATELAEPVQLAKLSRLLQTMTISIGLYVFTTVSLKISLAIFFLRLITKQAYRNTICICTAVYVVYGVVMAFISIFQCGNPQYFILNSQEGKCLSIFGIRVLNYVGGALNATTDWLYVIFPLHVLWIASMPRAAKVSAGILLCFAALGSICSLVRMAFIPGLNASDDFFSQSIDVAIWSTIEPGIAIVAASLATTRPMYKSLRDATRKIRSSSKKDEDTLSMSRITTNSLGLKTPVINHNTDAHVVVEERGPDPKIEFDFDFESSNMELAAVRKDEGQDVFYNGSSNSSSASFQKQPSLLSPQPTWQSPTRRDQGLRTKNGWAVDHSRAAGPAQMYVECGHDLKRQTSDPFADSPV